MNSRNLAFSRVQPTVTNVGDGDEAERFRLLATHLSGRSVNVTRAQPGDPPHTDGKFIYISSNGSRTDHRREVVVQAALLGAGSLDPHLVKVLKGRPKVARRYLSLEGHRVLRDLTKSLPLAAGLKLTHGAIASNSAQSLEIACGRRKIVEPPTWFGTIKTSRLLSAYKSDSRVRPSDADLRLQIQTRPTAAPDDDDDKAQNLRMRLFQNPLAPSSALTNLLAKLLGLSTTPEEHADDGGGELMTQSLVRQDQPGSGARPAPIPLRFGFGERPGPASGVGGVLYPEWDIHRNRYLPKWCRVVTSPSPPAPDMTPSRIERDSILRRRLADLSLSPRVCRRRADGDDLDVDALIDLAVDLRAGQSTSEHIYLERQKLERDLGVLILLDASGSATDTTNSGRSVHELQRRAAATLAVTLEELGDRVGIYGFRSRGRSAVQLIALKPFGRRFGAREQAQLNHLEPSGFTRIGAAVRHTGEVLKTESGTSNRLLLVISDGFPYDDGYESSYARADTQKAIEELRSGGVACLCLSIGAMASVEDLRSVFGAATSASATTLSELSPQITDLFLSALNELSVSQTRR